MEEKTCKTCADNDDGLCDRLGILIEDDDTCEKHRDCNGCFGAAGNDCQKCLRKEGEKYMGEVRNTYMRDYGLSDNDTKKIIDYCRNANGHDQQLILQAAQEVYPEIAPYLFANLTTGLGYDRMGNIPMQRKDFQGYRRKTIETYNRYMMLNGKIIT